MSQLSSQCTGICANGIRCSRQATAFRNISGRCGTHHRIWLRSHMATPQMITDNAQDNHTSIQTAIETSDHPSEHVVDPMDECSVCYNEVCMPITCPNGHRVCGQHFCDDII